jgi:FAD/FMN-containing dehydrogenase
MTDFATLASHLTGELLTPDDTGFDDSTAGFNSAIVHRPDAVVLPAGEDDVAETVRFARAEGLPVRIVATGHGGTVGYTDGIVIALQGLNSVSIDAGARTATFGGGTPWGLVVAAAAKHGLAPIIGSSPTVGAVGYLLGGGIGPLARSHGISSDYLRSLRVVTGEGEAVTASADENPDLF